MIQLHRSGGRQAVHCKALIPTPAGSIKNGQITAPDLLAEQLKQLKINHRWHKNRVNLCLGPQAFYLRRVFLPPLKDAERARAMRWEVEKHFPFPAAEAVFDYCPAGAGEIDRRSGSEYLLAAAAKETADAYAAVAFKAGLLPAALEIEPLSLLRSFSGCGKEAPAENNYFRLILNIGFERSLILVAGDGKYLFHRRLNTGIFHFCLAAKDKCGGNFRQAHRLIYSKKTLAEKNLQDTANRLVTQVAQSLAYWIDQSDTSLPPLRILDICGGGAFIPGLAAHIKQNLTVETRLYNPLRPFNGRAAEENGSNRDGALFAAAYGLALRRWLQ